MGGEEPKQFMRVAGRPVLAYALAAFESCDAVDGTVIVGPEDRLDTCASLWRQLGCRKVKDVVAGGKERQDSVLCGVNRVPAEVDVIAVHDGARPLVQPDDITRVVRAADASGAAFFPHPTNATTAHIKRSCFMAHDPNERSLCVKG